MPIPDKNKKFPLNGYEKLCFLKNIITNPNIIICDYTYYDDFETVENLEKISNTILTLSRTNSLLVSFV